jgi:hypothetical protein
LYNGKNLDKNGKKTRLNSQKRQKALVVAARKEAKM